MNIIFVGRQGRETRTLKLSMPAMWAALALALVIVPATLFFGGFFAGQKLGPSQEEVLVGSWQQEMAVQREEIATARRQVDENMNALAMRLGELQAKLIRLDALGERLTEMADLDKGEFDFTAKPALGGPSPAPSALDSMPVADFVQSLDDLSQRLDDREGQLGLLETMLMSRNLRDEVFPAGRPIKKGWISSYFGMRTDPFTGRPERHKGMDFAGKEGSEVIAVGSGVVTWAGERYGYGNLVEINHGNGYSTRYGHNKKVLVAVGDTVKKGQTLALMGSTGRSTGPHVHFEVRYKGKAVDPKKYALASR